MTNLGVARAHRREANAPFGKFLAKEPQWARATTPNISSALSRLAVSGKLKFLIQHYRACACLGVGVGAVRRYKEPKLISNALL